MKNNLLALMMFLLATASAFGQDDMDKINNITRLVQGDLRSPRIPIRDQAEKELIAMGEIVLDYMDIPTDADSVDFRERVTRIRNTLEKIAVARNTKASTIKLGDGKLSVEDLLAQIQTQTGNDVILGREVAMAKLEQPIEFKAGEYEFWQVLNQLMIQADLRIDPYDGEQGQMALAETAPVAGGAKPIILSDASSVMRFQVTSVNSHKNFENPTQNFHSINMTIRWEPRITPIAIDFPFDSIEIVDEFDQVMKSEQEGTYSGIVTPDIPELEFSINTPLFDRQIEEIKSFRGTVDAVLPGRIETFKFKDIVNVETDTFQVKAGAKVEFGGIEKNEDLWGLRVSLSFDEENNALESHQAWAYNNEVYLIDKDGNRYPPIGSETFQQTNEMVGILYYFGDDPKDMDLHYKTPAAVVKVKIPFVIHGIPLP